MEKTKRTRHSLNGFVPSHDTVLILCNCGDLFIVDPDTGEVRYHKPFDYDHRQNNSPLVLQLLDVYGFYLGIKHTL